MTDGAVAAHLPRQEELRARAEWPFVVGLVYLDHLMVDTDYQRPPHIAFISEIASTFDETLVGAIDVNAREDGTYAVLDGQQRFRAMEQVQKTACYCSIYRNMSKADEAGFFYRKNKDRKSMPPFYAFRARIVAGDNQALDIREAVEAEGFVLASATNEREAIGAISAVETIWGFSSEHREQCLTPTLKTVRGSFFGRRDSLDSAVMQGIGRFWHTFSDDEVRTDKLFETLTGLNPTNLKGMGHDRKNAATAGSRRGISLPWAIARVVTEEYNRAIKGKARGSQFAGRLDPDRLAF